jgi:hypothetical protein
MKEDVFIGITSARRCGDLKVWRGEGKCTE